MLLCEEATLLQKVTGYAPVHIPAARFLSHKKTHGQDMANTAYSGAVAYLRCDVPIRCGDILVRGNAESAQGCRDVAKLEKEWGVAFVVGTVTVCAYLDGRSYCCVTSQA